MKELKQIIRALNNWKDFVFSNPLLPYRIIREAYAHYNHLQIPQANPQLKFAKGYNFQPTHNVVNTNILLNYNFYIC